MKAYKGFNKDMTCRGYHFEEGKEYHEENATLCKRGFHACEDPIDCFSYYSPGQSVYREVELDELNSKKDDDSKICGKHIKIGAKLSVAKICKLHFEYIKSRCTNAEKGKAATAGSCGAATAGYKGAATSRGETAVGDCGAALVRGNNIRAKGGIGAIIVIVNEKENSYDVKEWKAGIIDGTNLKPDTWYKLENGEFVEAEDEA